MDLTANEHRALARFGSMNDRRWNAFMTLLDAVDAAGPKGLTGAANEASDADLVNEGLFTASRGALRDAL